MTGCGVNFEAIEGRALIKCPVGIFSEGASQKGGHSVGSRLAIPQSGRGIPAKRESKGQEACGEG